MKRQPIQPARSRTLFCTIYLFEMSHSGPSQVIYFPPDLPPLSSIHSQVQSAKDQNPLALPWFSGKHSSPCSICEDLWKVAWSAREDFLRDLKKSEGAKGYQLVASSGDNLRFVCACVPRELRAYCLPPQLPVHISATY